MSPLFAQAIAAELKVGAAAAGESKLPGPARRPRRLDRRARARPGGPPRQEPGHRRRNAASRGSRAGALDQPRAGQRRQDGRVHRSRRCGAGRPDRLAARAGPRHECRRGRHADHPGRQPGLRCPGRPRLRQACWPSDKIKLRIHLGLYDDETAQLCHWHIPEAHCLESWSDLLAFDGTATIQQPLIAPLYKGKSAHELLAVFLGEPDLSGLEIIRDYWRRRKLPGDFESAWRNGPRGRA